jgi:uncharacterized protein (TIGR03437 family)
MFPRVFGVTAAIGSTIVTCATGAGAMANVVDDRPAQPPYARLVPTPTVRIGDVPASIAYAGVAPGHEVATDLTIGSASRRAGVTVAIR